VTTAQQVTLSAAGSTDAESPNDLDYSWDLGNGGAAKDADGRIVRHTYPAPGVYAATVTVTDPQGLTDTASATVTVTGPGGGGGTTTPLKARIKLKSKKPDLTRKVRLSARKSTGAGPLTYAWNFHNGGKRIDATGKKVKIVFKRPGRKKVTLFVTDINAQRAKVTRKFRVRAKPAPAPRDSTARVAGTDSLTGTFWTW
jgi:PKD repeat protein